MTGEEIEIKAKKVPKFVAGKPLKDAMNKSESETGPPETVWPAMPPLPCLLT